MYGKIFESIYYGSLHGDWQTMVVFQQLIVLADRDGVVDRTPAAISAVTGIPQDIIEAGIQKLEQPDPMSRTPGDNGRRLRLLDSHRTWGWEIVNYSKFNKPERRRDLLTSQWQVVRMQVLERDNYVCQYCKKQMAPGRSATVDHVIPHSRGGGMELDNLTAACRSCNAKKKDRSMSFMVDH